MLDLASSGGAGEWSSVDQIIQFPPRNFHGASKRRKAVELRIK